MPSYAKKQKRGKIQKPAHEVKRFAPRGAREVPLHELAHVLSLPAVMLQAIANSQGFPAPLGRRSGERVWLLAEVADNFERTGWPQDAKALREWGG